LSEAFPGVDLPKKAYSMKQSPDGSMFWVAGLNGEITTVTAVAGSLVQIGWINLLGECWPRKACRSLHLFILYNFESWPAWIRYRAVGCGAARGPFVSRLNQWATSLVAPALARCSCTYFVLQLTGSTVLDVSGGDFYVKTEEVRAMIGPWSSLKERQQITSSVCVATFPDLEMKTQRNTTN